MNLGAFLKQTSEWRVRQDTDTDGRPVLSAASTIPVRREERLRLMRSNDGSEYQASTEIMTVEAVGVGDYMDEQEVLGRESIVDVGGVTLGYQLFL